MRIVPAVAATSQLQQFLLGPIVAAYIQLTADGVGRNHVPESAYAIVSRIARIKGRVGEVESHVHYTYDNPFASKGLWQADAFVGLGGIQVEGHRVVEQLVHAVGLNAQHPRIMGYRSQLLQRQRDDMNISEVGQRPSAVTRQHFVGTVGDAHQECS